MALSQLSSVSFSEAAEFFNLYSPGYVSKKLGDLNQFSVGVKALSPFSNMQSVPGLEVFISRGLSSTDSCSTPGPQLRCVKDMITHVFHLLKPEFVEDYLSTAYTVMITYNPVTRNGRCPTKEVIASVHFHTSNDGCTGEGAAYIGFLVVSDGLNSSRKPPIGCGEPVVGSWRRMGLGRFLLHSVLGICKAMRIRQIALHISLDGDEDQFRSLREFYSKECFQYPKQSAVGVGVKKLLLEKEARHDPETHALMLFEFDFRGESSQSRECNESVQSNQSSQSEWKLDYYTAEVIDNPLPGSIPRVVRTSGEDDSEGEEKSQASADSNRGGTGSTGSSESSAFHPPPQHTNHRGDTSV
jgi:hypothetical protein